MCFNIRTPSKFSILTGTIAVIFLLSYISWCYAMIPVTRQAIHTLLNPSCPTAFVNLLKCITAPFRNPFVSPLVSLSIPILNAMLLNCWTDYRLHEFNKQEKALSKTLGKLSDDKHWSTHLSEVEKIKLRSSILLDSNRHFRVLLVGLTGFSGVLNTIPNINSIFRQDTLGTLILIAMPILAMFFGQILTLQIFPHDIALELANRRIENLESTSLPATKKKNYFKRLITILRKQ